MRVHPGELSDVTRYLENNRDVPLEQKEPEFRNYLRLIERFKHVDPSISMLEIGTGTGWFPILCQAKGLRCKGLEISAQLVDFARWYGRRYNAEPDIELGNIEEADLAAGCYDVIIAHSVFEHIECWRPALRRIYQALKPGGVFLFSSTNKFAFHSGEYDFPLYGWLPNAWRYRLRIARQGADIMKLGIDFNQFTYPGLRRALHQAGFSRIIDRVQMAEPDPDTHLLKRIVLVGAKAFAPLRHLALLVSDATIFVCIK